MSSVTPQELARLLQRPSPPRVIDVRTRPEFDEVHAEGASNLPLHLLDHAQLESSGVSPTDPLYLLCQTGTRAAQAARHLSDHGFRQVFLVEGGTQAWVAAGLPVVRGRKAVSLERQVRIVAGGLVVLGIALGFLVHPGFYGLALFVGSGLVFAGITDFCGMGLLLARAPWNQRKTS